MEMAKAGLDASPVSQILVEKSLLGWKEYELEASIEEICPRRWQLNSLSQREREDNDLLRSIYTRN